MSSNHTVFIVNVSIVDDVVLIFLCSSFVFLFLFFYVGFGCFRIFWCDPFDVGRFWGTLKSCNGEQELGKDGID